MPTNRTIDIAAGTHEYHVDVTPDNYARAIRHIIQENADKYIAKDAALIDDEDLDMVAHQVYERFSTEELQLVRDTNGNYFCRNPITGDIVDMFADIRPGNYNHPVTVNSSMPTAGKQLQSDVQYFIDNAEIPGTTRPVSDDDSDDIDDATDDSDDEATVEDEPDYRFDPDLDDELFALHITDGEPTMGTIGEVHGRGDYIELVVSIEAGDALDDEFTERFRRPESNDEGRAFNHLLDYHGYDLGSANHLLDEDIPCEYDGDDWFVDTDHLGADITEETFEDPGNPLLAPHLRGMKLIGRGIKTLVFLPEIVTCGMHPHQEYEVDAGGLAYSILMWMCIIALFIPFTDTLVDILVNILVV